MLSPLRKGEARNWPTKNSFQPLLFYMRRNFLLFFSLVLSIMFIGSGCFGDNGRSFGEVNRSADGVLLEQAFPADTWFALSFSTLQPSQREGFQGIMARIAGDPDAFRDAILSGIDANLSSVDLSYVEDIQPILGGSNGEAGFRFLMGMSEGAPGEVITHVGMTVADSAAAKNLFENLEREGRFLKRVKGGQSIYFNANAAESDEDIYYFTLSGSLLLIANDEDELLDMVDLQKTSTAESLWTKASYQEVIDDLPSEYLTMLYLDTGAVNARRAEAMSRNAVAVNLEPPGIAKYIVTQGFSFVATDDGLDFRGIAKGDREAIQRDGATLDQIKAKKAYLHEMMPAEQLGVYLESYNFGAALERQFGDGADVLSGLSGQGLGIDPSTFDFEDLFGRGYALAFHQNSGFIPGLTIMVDASDGPTVAKTLIDALDQQVQGLLQIFQIQGGAIAQALVQEKKNIRGETFSVLRLDVDAVLSLYQDTGAFSLPAEAGGEDIYLIYGITEDDMVVISTYEGWLQPEGVSLFDSVVYRESLKRLDEFKEGIVYVEFDPLLEFLNVFQGFRSALGTDR